MKIEHTGGGFEVINFNDRCGIECSLQQSTTIGDADNAMQRPGSSFVWLGIGGDRMHLDADTVREIWRHLGNWLLHGSFEDMQ
jgi:hypothetical protein